ncbi:MAG: Hsp20/alpha crystallin family protein, partial [Tabrizicola sp.]|nr:Hsp20/alpha crystallin family protein [Tabrizicola sp.]
ASRPWSAGLAGAADRRWPVAPAIDVVEKDGNLEITAELPGLAEKDVEVKMVNNTLVIKGEKTDETEERKKDYYLSERRYGSFQRSFRLPEGTDADKIAARFDKGVLTVTLPVPASASAAERQIPVTTCVAPARPLPTAGPRRPPGASPRDCRPLTEINATARVRARLRVAIHSGGRDVPAHDPAGQHIRL